ncbi:MarR family winged helix-turn-helix transcriptional regulator [Kineococcus sp. NUM-3379]
MEPSPPRDVAEDAAAVPDGLDARLAAAVERLGAAQRGALRARASAAGLSPIQAQLLGCLRDAPPARRRTGALAAELDVTAPTVSDAVAALRRKGLVTAAPVPGDRRGQVLALTDAGHDVVRGALGPADPLAAALAGHDGPGARARKESALPLLLDLVADLHRAGVIGVARTCTTCRFFRRDLAPGTAAPHACALLGAPLGPGDLRVDCAEHESA